MYFSYKITVPPCSPLGYALLPRSPAPLLPFWVLPFFIKEAVPCLSQLPAFLVALYSGGGAVLVTATHIFNIYNTVNIKQKSGCSFMYFNYKHKVPLLGTPILPPFIQEAVPCLSQRHAFLLLIYLLSFRILTIFDTPKNILFRKQKSGYVKCTNFPI